MSETDPLGKPSPASPLETALSKLTEAIKGHTQLQRDGIKLHHQALKELKKIDSLLVLLNNFRSSEQINAERTASLLTQTRAQNEDLREIRRMVGEQHVRIVETSTEVRLVARRQEDWTPPPFALPTPAELTEPPSGLHKGGINFSWGMLGRIALKLLPIVLSGGWVLWIWSRLKG